MADRERFMVTGGAGFIGSNVVAEIMKRRPDADLLVIDDMRTGSYANLVAMCERKGVGRFTGRLVPESVAEVGWHAAMDALEPTAVFHLGAITDTRVRDEKTMLADNSETFVDILDACAEAEVPLVYASSAATYGRPEQAERREAFPIEAGGDPLNVYGFSKWLMECEHGRMARDRAAEGKDPAWVIGLRYFNVFGPGEASKGSMASMAYHLFEQMRGGDRPRLFHDGSQTRDQVYVDDVVDATLAAGGLGTGLERGDRPTAGVYNVGSGVGTSFDEIADAVRRAVPEFSGLETEYFEMPEVLRGAYQAFTLADVSAGEAGLGWMPSHRPSEAIEQYAGWLWAEASRFTATTRL